MQRTEVTDRPTTHYFPSTPAQEILPLLWQSRTRGHELDTIIQSTMTCSGKTFSTLSVLSAHWYSCLNCMLRPYNCGGQENLIHVYRQHLSRDLKCHWCQDVNVTADPEIMALIQVISYNDVLKLEHWPRLATL